MFSVERNSSDETSKDTMNEPVLAYSVRDRSILLPFYKRLFVEPTLPAIPSRLSPNAITHAGHAVNLLALVVLLAAGPTKGGVGFLLAAFLVQVYLWCDNADGSHARRTNQCSALGEFLDHGLDLLNATYIACMTVVTLGAPPFWSAVAVVVVPAAAAVTYWEQAETGTFQLGLLNQVESVFALSLLLVLRGVFGLDFAHVYVGPVSFAVALLGALCATATFGILRSALRVSKHRGRLAPFVAPLGFGIAITIASATGTLGTLAAIVVGSAVFVFLGIRQLSLRVHGRRPLVERGVLVAAAAIVALVAYRLIGGHVGATLDWTAACVAIACFGGLAAFHAIGGHREVARLDRAPRAATGAPRA
jgi:phosphatidylglycerophosphate synthase